MRMVGALFSRCYAAATSWGRSWAPIRPSCSGWINGKMVSTKAVIEGLAKELNILPASSSKLADEIEMDSEAIPSTW
jgi:hypothetical protein